MDANGTNKMHLETSIDLQSGRLRIAQSGTVHLIDIMTGNSWIVMGQGIEIPTMMRFPKEWAFARFWYSVHRYWKFMFGAFLFIVALVTLQLALAVTYPGDMWAHFIAIFSFWMNSALVATGSLAFVAWFVKRFYSSGVNLSFNEAEDTKALEAGEISIAPDIIVMTRYDEAVESFELRMNEAIESTEGTQKWVLVIAKGQATFAVIKNTENLRGGEHMTMLQTVFLRTMPFQNSDFAENDFAFASRKFRNETYTEFFNWCKGLAEDFKRWAEFEKLGKTDHLQTIVNMAKTISTICFLIVAPIFCFGQKIEQVKQYLGERSELLIPKSGQKVQYIFERRETEVTADGSRNVVELLSGTPFFTDNSKDGSLLAIKIAGETVLPKPKETAKASVTKAEPVSAIPIPENGSMFDNFPDSNAAEVAKAEIMRSRAKDWVKVKPWVELQMWMFYQILGIVLLMLAFMLWVAWVSSADTMDDMYGHTVIGEFMMGCYIWSKAVSAAVMYVIGGVFVLERCVIYWYTGEVLSIGFVAKMVGYGIFWYLVAKKLLPNIKRNPAGGGGYSSAFNNDNQRRLN